MTLQSLATLSIGVVLATSVQASTQPQTQYDDLICSYEWSCTQARRIMWCESSGRTWVINQGNYGLMQINRIHAPEFTVNNDPTEFLNPEFNIQVAFQLYQRRGWQPWQGCL